MKFSSIASGSAGNCFYIENKSRSILVDIGISAKQTVNRLALQGIDPKKVEAILVTHEHIDHIRGIDVFARKFNVPILATRGTIKNSFLCSNKELIQEIKSNETFKLAGLEINTFSKSHDAEEPVFFQIKNDKTISIITDAGFACDNIKNAVAESDYLILEANHDVKMLENGPYPYHIKKRILSDKGHLSNLHSALCVLENANKKLKQILLAHLSHTNNTPEIALQTYQEILRERKKFSPILTIGKQGEASSLFRCI